MIPGTPVGSANPGIARAAPAEGAMGVLELSLGNAGEAGRHLETMLGPVLRGGVGAQMSFARIRNRPGRARCSTSKPRGD
jgi:hypothetical protein